MKLALNHLLKVLSFRSKREDMLTWGWAELTLGIVCTIIVGAGRWWDDTRDLPLYVHFGIGSVAYVLVLGSVLWVLIRTLADEPPSFVRVLTFVCFVSPPAMLYAVPVEQWMDMASAQSLNLQFLAVVAAYRVALLVHFCRVSVLFDWTKTIVTTFLPISIAIFFVAQLNVTGVIIDFMGGVRGGEPNRKAEMETFVMLLSCLSWIVTPILTLMFLSLWLQRGFEHRAARKSAEGGQNKE